MTKTETFYIVIAYMIVGGVFVVTALVSFFLPIAVFNTLQSPEVQSILDKVPAWQLRLTAYIGIALIIGLAVSGLAVVIEHVKKGPE